MQAKIAFIIDYRILLTKILIKSISQYKPVTDTFVRQHYEMNEDVEW